MKFVLMTANTSGGIIQFTIQLYHTLKALGHNVKICIPDVAVCNNTNEVEEENIILYKKVKKVINKTEYTALAKRIEAEIPDCIWYCEPSVVCMEVGIKINRKIKQLLTIHDAGGYHPTNKLNFKVILQRFYENMLCERIYRCAHKMVLLSPQSMKKFCNDNPKFKNKSIHMNLGAHIPQEPATMPVEAQDLCTNKYLLFFGRIDKYKGLLNLFKAHKEVDGTALPLVIAGSGSLSKEETTAISEIKNIVLINRFISDGEMKWLFENSKALFLPYIEATQSGIIPIAYSYSKPVAVSDIKGLTQFVEAEKTGCICKNQADWIAAIKGFTDDTLLFEGISEYYSQNMDWNNNVKGLIEKI